jgi:PAS domain S-box-containing protein
MEPESPLGYRELLDTAPDAIIVVGPDSRILFANQQTAGVFGYRPEELVGQPLSILIPERARSAHVGHVSRFMTSPGLRPMGSGIELYGRRTDGSEIPIEVSLSPVRTEKGVLVSAAIRDITERKKIQAAVRVTAERLASAVESIHDAFALFDAEDKLLLCNSVYRRLVGDAVSGPLVGRMHAELLDAWTRDLDFASEEERDRFRETCRKAWRESGGTYDVRDRDGRNLRVMDRRTPEGGIVETVWDLTEDMRLAEELRQARLAAEAGSEAKSEFLSSMSHELRTPLNAVLGFAQLLRRDRREPITERQKERVDQILKGGEHLLRLIDDILDLSRIEAGRTSLSTEPVDVVRVVEEVCTTLEPMAARSGIHLSFERPQGELPMVATDRTRFAQILMNFGSNALKYNRPSGSVTFRISSADGPGFVRVVVADTGIGIPRDKQDRLFQPFQRAGQETGPIEGTGIGLVITKRLAALMNGTVGFSSVEGQGSEFWVDMPAHRGAAVSRPERSGHEKSSPGLLATGRQLVLYVEDNPANVAFMQDLLSAFGNVELVTATSAEAGLELARLRKPAIILMDINLPGMSGLDALHALRQDPTTRSIPVVALTAAASARDRKRGEEAGFFRYLTKPVKVDELEAALDAVLS